MYVCALMSIGRGKGYEKNEEKVEGLVRYEIVREGVSEG